MKTREFLSTALSAALLICAFAAPTAHAYVAGHVGTIVRFWTYSTFGNGDIAITVTSPLNGCDGFWLRSSDPGFKNVYAQLLTARVQQMPLSIWAFDDQRWSGSGERFCRIDAVDFAN